MRINNLSGSAFGSGAVTVESGATLTGGGDLDVVFFGGFTPTGSVSFQLFQATSIGGTFATINLPSLASGCSWDTSQLESNGILGLNAIPEPAACATLAALTLAATRRRRSR